MLKKKKYIRLLYMALVKFMYFSYNVLLEYYHIKCRSTLQSHSQIRIPYSGKFLRGRTFFENKHQLEKISSSKNCGKTASFCCRNIKQTMKIFRYLQSTRLSSPQLLFANSDPSALVCVLRASCLMLEIKEFRCYEAKLEESEKGRQPLRVEPWLEPPVLCH